MLQSIAVLVLFAVVMTKQYKVMMNHARNWTTNFFNAHHAIVKGFPMAPTFDLVLHACTTSR